MVIKNAIIKKAEIEIESHGILTAFLTLDFGGSGQGFGGYSLDYNKANPTDACAIFVRRMMEIGGVERWDSLVGKTIRVEKNNDFGKIIRVGHIINDDWFDPEKDF